MPVGPNLVLNPGFETGDFADWTVTDPEPANPDIGVDSQPLDVNSGTYGAFAGNETSTLSQTISTVVGHTYEVSFYLDVYQSTAYNGDADVTFGGQTVVDLVEPTETDAFTKYTAEITATSTTSTLEFSLTDPGGYFGLDDVSVDDTICYGLGTRILTDEGERAVEALQIGDVAVLASGETRPIRWIGRRKITLHRHPRPESARPVRIEAGALGDQLPRRDLIVSPEHALWLEDRLVPARSLINGATVRQEAWSHVEYFHVELDEHEILVAEGVAAESYLDCDNRIGFDNSRDGVVRLHANWGERAEGRPFASPALTERLRLRFATRAAERGRSEEMEAFEAGRRARALAARSNFVRNPRAEGSHPGPLGAGGQAPHFWWLDAPEAIVIEILAVGEEGGLPCLDVRFVGRASRAGACSIHFQPGAAAPASRGQDWTVSVYLRLLGGGFDGVASVNLYFDETDAVGAYLTGAPYRQPLPTADELALQRLSATRRLSRPDVAAMTGYVQLQMAVDVDVDVSLRVAGAQIERGDYASDLILPPPAHPGVGQRLGPAAIELPAAEHRAA